MAAGALLTEMHDRAVQPLTIVNSTAFLAAAKLWFNQVCWQKIERRLKFGQWLIQVMSYNRKAMRPQHRSSWPMHDLDGEETGWNQEWHAVLALSEEKISLTVSAHAYEYQLHAWHRPWLKPCRVVIVRSHSKISITKVAKDWVCRGLAWYWNMLLVLCKDSSSLLPSAGSFECQLECLLKHWQARSLPLQLSSNLSYI